MTQARIDTASYFIMGISLFLVLVLGLLPAFLAGFLIYHLVVLGAGAVGAHWRPSRDGPGYPFGGYSGRDHLCALVRSGSSCLPFVCRPRKLERSLAKNGRCGLKDPPRSAGMGSRLSSGRCRRMAEKRSLIV